MEKNKLNVNSIQENNSYGTPVNCRYMPEIGTSISRNMNLGYKPNMLFPRGCQGYTRWRRTNEDVKVEYSLMGI